MLQKDSRVDLIVLNLFYRHLPKILDYQEIVVFDWQVPFGSGIARMQETCGAVTGALMAIGLKYGKGENGTEDDKTIAYRQSQFLVNEFKKRNTTICCRQLLDGYDMNSPQEMAKIMELDLYNNYCLKYIQDAVEITETILSDKEKH